jgi:hypothetical protein
MAKELNYIYYCNYNYSGTINFIINLVKLGPFNKEKEGYWRIWTTRIPCRSTYRRPQELGIEEGGALSP